jgi:A nuclease family of the HNH/ENDO VII superfamily with conserved AHH
VKEGVHAIAKQIGVATAKCENLVEQLTHYADGTLRRWYLEDPTALGEVLDICAAELDKISTIPTFEDDWLAMAAKEAFEKGYGAGVDEVANRMLVIELAVDAIEMILVPELFLLEMAATRAIRASMASLRRMPIFVPGAMNGIGVFMTVAPKVVAKTVAEGSAKVLARAMKLVGKIRLPGEFCHHIVAHGAERAKPALAILKKFGINVDEAVNGVFLPGFEKSLNPLKKAVHGNLHKNSYYDAVNEMLKDANSPAEVRRILRDIALDLEKGIVPK